MGLVILSAIEVTSVWGNAAPVNGSIAQTRSDESDFFGPEFPGIARPDCPDSTQLGLNRCSYEWEQAAAERREALYQWLEDDRTAAEADAMYAVEATWRAFESTFCALVSDGYREGSIYPLILNSCRATRHNERIVALTQWEPAEPPWPDYFTVLPQLEAAYAAALEAQSLRLQAGLPTNQILWESYREQHCQWEVEQPSHLIDVETDIDRGDRLNRCYTRLTLQRIEQLQYL
ncbi:MAG: lysozyme inhibitor LprI family protein [Cyanobacteria bacterium J06628_6]